MMMISGIIVVGEDTDHGEDGDQKPSLRPVSSPATAKALLSYPECNCPVL
jgi:hypothetical protein